MSDLVLLSCKLGNIEIDSKKLKELAYEVRSVDMLDADLVQSCNCNSLKLIVK